jgi:hypothetical protein
MLNFQILNLNNLLTWCKKCVHIYVNAKRYLLKLFQKPGEAGGIRESGRESKLKYPV